MKIVERTTRKAGEAVFDLDEFLARPLFAHLSTSSEHGPRESPVWFLWHEKRIWIIGGESFPRYLQREPRCAIGIVDFDWASGKVQPDQFISRRIVQKYCGAQESEWDSLFDDTRAGQCQSPMICFEPETVVIRDQSYQVGPSFRAELAAKKKS
jgi:hypothetical protein